MSDKLIRMANQIADFFRSQPDGDAAKAVARHLNDFWPPVMRQELQQALTGGAQADPLVEQAAQYLDLPEAAKPSTR